MKKYLGSCLLFLAATAFAPGETKSDSESPTVALTNVTIIDTTGKHPGDRATVLIRGDRISEIGQPGAIQMPAGAQIIDGAGKFLMPGLWDMHMHLSYLTESAFPLLIANGVTGVCDMGGDLDEIDAGARQLVAG